MTRPPPPAARNLDALPTAAGASIAAVDARWLADALDALDYGVLLLDGTAQVLWGNEAAHHAMARVLHHEPGCGHGRGLTPREADERGRLRQACAVVARKRLRQWITLAGAPGSDGYELALQPVGDADEQTGCGHVLAVLSRREPCERLSLDAYARAHGLTLAEGHVLTLFAQGHTPKAIASRLSVQLSTVRTHLRHIRAKSGLHDQKSLLRRLATLPPLVSALRNVAGN